MIRKFLNNIHRQKSGIGFLILVFLFLFISNNDFVYSQSIKDSTFLKSMDTSAVFKDFQKKMRRNELDTNNAEVKKYNLNKKSNDLDSLVVYNAKKSANLNLKSKVLRLNGNSDIKLKQQKLEADIIELYFEDGLLKSSGTLDSNQKIIGYPKFNDKGEIFYGEKILFNFKTKQGTITMGETEQDKAYYFGSKIKRVSESELFVQDGCYTTCDHPHPHYYFGSPKMKVIVQDRIFIDPIIFYVEDMPIFILPVGLFFPSKTGRQSGIMIPKFFFSSNRGVALEDFGLYLALSDYYDTKFAVNFYSKGGYLLKNSTQWVLKDEFSGNIDLQYGKTRFNPEDEYKTDYRFGLVHHQNITPSSKIDVNLNFTSQNFNRNTSINLFDRVQQNATSTASYYTSFDNGSSISLSYNREQNIITNEYNQNPTFSFNLPQYKPFKKLYPSSWVGDISVNYAANMNYNSQVTRSILSKVVSGTTVLDTQMIYSNRSRINHSPSISISPKLGYFTFTPGITFSASNFFRKLTRNYNAVDSTTFDQTENGLFTEFDASLYLTASTTLFGVLNTKQLFGKNIFGISALRHTFQPSVSYSIRPDLSSDKLGFYSSYYDLKQKKDIIYSRYTLDGGGCASRMNSQSLSYSIVNAFEAKVYQNDSIPDKNLKFLTMNFNGGYNFNYDSLKFNDISMNFWTPGIADISFSGGGTFTAYSDDKTKDVNGALTGAYHRVNRLLMTDGKMPLRLTSINFQMSTTFNSSGASFGSTAPGLTADANNGEDPEGAATKKRDLKKDSVGIGERFKQRMEYKEEYFDFFGENTPGYSALTLPWSLNLALNFQWENINKNIINRSIFLTGRFNVMVSKSWMINATANYDVVKKEMITPSFTISKQLHCWSLDFDWYPTGYNQGFYLRFGINSDQLKDLKFEKRSSVIY